MNVMTGGHCRVVAKDAEDESTSNWRTDCDVESWYGCR